MAPQRSEPRPGRRQPVALEGGPGSSLPRLPGGVAAPAPSRVEAERDALMRIAAAAAAATSLEDVLELTAEAAHAAIGEGGLSVTTWDREADTMRILITAGGPGQPSKVIPEGKSFPLSQFPDVARLLRTGTPQFVTVDDPDADERAVEVLKERGMESSIGVPIVVDARVWGGVWAASPSGAPSFRARDVRFLETIAGQLAAVVDRAERFSNVSRLAYEDPLTGLANRRALEERLDRAAAHYRSDGVPLALLVCDVDNLKAINDERGHQAGDRALRRVGEALVAAASAYPTALVARLSGDEFSIVVEGHSVSVAREVAATALKLLREGRDVRVSLSCGAAAASTGADTSSTLLRAADTAQYAAKRRGGDQICTADTTTAAATESPSPRRRVSRRSLGDRLERRSTELLRSLDGAYREARTIDRLEMVTAGFAATLNAAAWTISFVDHGSPTIRSVSTADDRDGRLRGIRVALEDDVYLLADYPATHELVTAGAGYFQVDRHDRDADPAERKLLAELGFSSVLATSVSDLDGVHLIELYSDGDSGDLSMAALRLQLLARAAAGRSAGTTARMAQLGKRTHQLSVTAALGTRLASLTDHAEIVEVAVDALYREVGFPACGICRLTPDHRLELTGGRGAAIERLLGTGWSQPAGLGLIGRSLRDRAVVMVGDVRQEPDYRLNSETPDIRSELCVPLWAGDDLWGVIDIEDPRLDAFDEDDARLVKMVADQVSAALRSASLFGQLEAAYLGTAESLVAALEAKDAYTASRSRSIGENAEAVGRELGLDEAEVRTLRFGAAFNDIGKLAIPESILAKPEPLTAEERMRIEQHTVIGDQILAPIEFLADVRPLVRGGHERWDGGGYPDGLAGEDIPLGARIIFACDAYDAMTSDRPYRPALGDDVAAAQLADNAGTQFDPRVVKALLTVLGERGLRRREIAAS